METCGKEKLTVQIIFIHICIFILYFYINSFKSEFYMFMFCFRFAGLNNEA